MRNVRDCHRPCFMISVSVKPCSFMAMAPPARREWTPTRSGSMPFLERSSSTIVLRMCLIRSWEFTCFHVLSSESKKSHMQKSSCPPLDNIWWTRAARALTGHVSECCRAIWCIVVPIRPFF